MTGTYPSTCDKPHLLKIPLVNTTDFCFSPDHIKKRNSYFFLPDGSVQVCRNKLRRRGKFVIKFFYFSFFQIIKYNFPISPASYCGEHTVHDGDVFVEDNLFICIDPKDIRPIKFGNEKTRPKSLNFRNKKFRDRTDISRHLSETVSSDFAKTDGSSCLYLNFFLFSDIYGIIMLIGGVVLLITVAISLYLPELRTSVYYRIIICHNFSLMIANFTWGTTNLLPSMPYSACVFLSKFFKETFA